MIDFGKIYIEDYNYNLPDEKIAKFPSEIRDESKLLILNKEKISEDKFFNVTNYLPDNSLLVFNNTKVIHARLIFKKDTGTEIEIFCLNPVFPTNDFQLAFQKKGCCTWKCLIGNSKRWKSGKLKFNFSHNGNDCFIEAERKETYEDAFLVDFSWNPEHFTFSEILEYVGLVPLPPYINRNNENIDNERYQTIYAKEEGSVAAPTAGLHFTNRVFSDLKLKNISTNNVSLHVGAGTFKPVSSSTIDEHKMHVEKIVVTKDIISEILEYKDKNKNIIAVGTTTIRTLESIYWFGVKLLVEKSDKTIFDISQWTPYEKEYSKDITLKSSYEAVLNYMKKNKTETLQGQTQLMIVPGYKFRVIDIIITNFHQPKSTLLLLVSAFIGEKWKYAYEYAITNNFRFLSYGDSCLFIR